DQLGGRMDPELPVDVRPMSLDRLQADAERLGDVPAGQTLDDPPEDLPLAARELVDARRRVLLAAPAQPRPRPRTALRRQVTFAPRRQPNGLDDLSERLLLEGVGRDAGLESVPHEQ